MGFLTRTTGTDATSVAERLRNRTVRVIDVREPWEWQAGHIRGSTNIPLRKLAERLERMPSDQTIVVVCASGHRSASAARQLQRAGCTVENLHGGMRAWSKAALPVERGK